MKNIKTAILALGFINHQINGSSGPAFDSALSYKIYKAIVLEKERNLRELIEARSKAGKGDIHHKLYQKYDYSKPVSDMIPLKFRSKDPLRIAIENCNPESVWTLIQAGASVARLLKIELEDRLWDSVSIIHPKIHVTNLESLSLHSNLNREAEMHDKLNVYGITIIALCFDYCTKSQSCDIRCCFSTIDTYPDIKTAINITLQQPYTAKNLDKLIEKELKFHGTRFLQLEVDRHRE